MWKVVKTSCFPKSWTIHWGVGYSDNSAFFMTEEEAQKEADRCNKEADRRNTK